MMRRYPGQYMIGNAGAFTGNTGGFTLIEVLAAMAILAIAFTAVLQANLRIQDSILASRRQTAATMLASTVMARIESEGVDQWSRFSGREERLGLALSWRVRTERTSARDLQRVRVLVREQGRDDVLARRESFLERTDRD
ncbi:MAG: type II secretion system minor pseudopilin GspI [Desulfohalobiaceae bacterium]